MKTKSKTTKAVATKTVTKKAQKKKVLITAISVSAAGILGYFGWQYYKKQKDKKMEDEAVVLKPIKQIPSNYPAQDSSVWTKPRTVKVRPVKADNPETAMEADFPLRKGSKGDHVKTLQEALMAKHGKNILPRYGADGFFGGEMATALKQLKLPASIDQTTFNVLTQGRTATKTNTAQKLFDACIKADFKTAQTILKTIKNKEEYTTVSQQFKTFRINGVRQTLVNGMLNSFRKEEQKQAIRFEFIRMGLQYDGSKWSLSGLGGLPLITSQETTIWLNASNGVKVPARMVLGNEVSKKLDYTLFENKGKYFLVSTNATNYLNR